MSPSESQGTAERDAAKKLTSVEPVSFKDFYTGMGFDEHPFSLYTAEKEHERQKELFIEPTYYGPIAENLLRFSSMFLVGERGTGKTALIYNLKHLSEDKNIVVLVDDFSSIKQSYKAADLYHLILQNVSDQVFKLIFQNQKVLKNLTDSDRLLLSYLYQNFASATTKAELLVRIDQIQNRFWRRLALRIYSFLRWPLNWAATAGVNAISDATSKALGISSQVSEDEIRVYFPDLPFKSDLSFNDVTASLRLIERFTQLVKKLGFGKTVVILDKLDEDQRLEGDADAIAEFIRPVVSDNNLLLSNEIQVIASIWSVPFTILKKKNIRTQKINVEILSWDHRDLQRALNNRLTAFSSGRIRNMEEILAEDVSDETKNKVFLLANKSPRDLWHAMDKILREQFRLDRLSKKVSTAGIEAGLRTFVEHFDYYEYYPRRAGSRSNTLDVYAYIRHLLKLSGKEFTRKQLTDRAGVAGGSASNYVNSMENMGLISTRGQDGGITVYSIRDPKIVFALENSLEIKADDR